MATARPHHNDHLDHLRKRTNDLGHNVQELGRIAKDMAQETMDAIKENAGEYYQQGVDRAKEMEKDLEKKIKEKPMQSLLIALGLGFIVGWLFHRR